MHAGIGVFLCGFLFGCVTLTETTGKEENLVGFRLSGTLTVHTPGGKMKGNLVVVSDGWENLRLEFVTHLGGVTGVLWVSRNTWILWDPAQRLAIRGGVGETLKALPFLPPLYRDGILLTLAFLSLKEGPPFATLRERLLPDGVDQQYPFPKRITGETRYHLLDLSPPVTVEYLREEGVWRVTEGLWVLEFHSESWSPFLQTRERAELFIPRVSPGTTWRSFGEFYSSFLPAPQKEEPLPTP